MRARARVRVPEGPPCQNSARISTCRIRRCMYCSTLYVKNVALYVTCVLIWCCMCSIRCFGFGVECCRFGVACGRNVARNSALYVQSVLGSNQTRNEAVMQRRILKIRTVANIRDSTVHIHRSEYSVRHDNYHGIASFVDLVP